MQWNRLSKVTGVRIRGGLLIEIDMQGAEAQVLMGSRQVLSDADAVLAASVFHFGTYTVHEVKEAMARAGVPVRL